MVYKVKESFLTLQGEGAQAGRLSVFVRFSGCNNWSGRAEDREQGPADCARWCDTEFVGTDGDGGGRYDLESLLGRIQSLWPAGKTSGPTASPPYVVFTGGEPALQLDQALVDGLHQRGALVAVETNGSLPLPTGLDWVCVSPKRLLNGSPQPLVVTSGQELKLVMPQTGFDLAALESLDFEHFFIQPLDQPGDAAKHSRDWCLDWIQRHPRWRLSLQTHKMIGMR
ncbi:MAG: 7-carboxy-7-deazaguanine synthase [Pseudomonadota bacterium]|jgi:7-carboxy-7-deazaguanine synthase (Cx14CxxC type)